MEDPRPSVLFVCVHNAGRSQMAAALVERMSSGQVRVLSAGSAPAEAVNPVVVEALAELGIDVSQNVPRRLEETEVAASDLVVTMGCGDACPVHPGVRYEDWDVPDPSGRDLDAVRGIRDQIAERVRGLLDRLGVREANGSG